MTFKLNLLKIFRAEVARGNFNETFLIVQPKFEQK